MFSFVIARATGIIGGGSRLHVLTAAFIFSARQLIDLDDWQQHREHDQRELPVIGLLRRVDVNVVILDKLGYLPFSDSGGALLRRLRPFPAEVVP